MIEYRPIIKIESQRQMSRKIINKDFFFQNRKVKFSFFRLKLTVFLIPVVHILYGRSYAAFNR
jgi:hypothetical protein